MSDHDYAPFCYFWIFQSSFVAAPENDHEDMKSCTGNRIGVIITEIFRRYHGCTRVESSACATAHSKGVAEEGLLAVDLIIISQNGYMV